MSTDPTQTYMNRKLVNVDDFSTDGRPDTMKILPDVRRKLRKAIAAQQEEATLERADFIRWLQGVVSHYTMRARARKS